MSKLSIILVCFLFTFLQIANSSPTDVSAAGKTKQNNYLWDTTFYGGNASAPPMTINGLRRSKNAGYERIVIDLTTTDITSAPPYFQVALQSPQNINISVRGIQNDKLSQANIDRAIAHSSIIGKSYLSPILENDLFSLQFTLKKPSKVEAFYLTNPPRIILDVQTTK